MSTPLPTRVVLEFGSAYVRGGVAGRFCPHFVVPTPAALLEGLPSRKAYLEVLSRLFVDYLQLRPKECQVVVVEKVSATRAHRSVLLTVLLRDLRVLGATMQIDLCLAVLSSSPPDALGMPSLTGLVVDIGERETRVLAVALGRPLMQTLRLVPLGMAHARDVFARLLRGHFGAAVEAASDASIRSLFERASLAPLAEQSHPDLKISPGTLSPKPLVLPSRLRHLPLLVLLRGEDHSRGGEQEVEVVVLDGLSGALADSILSLSADTRASCLANVLVTGGGGGVPGMAEALCRETARLVGLRPRLARLAGGLGGARGGLSDAQLTPSSSSSSSPADNGNGNGAEGGGGGLGGPHDAGMRPGVSAFAPDLQAWTGGSLFGRLTDARYAAKYVCDAAAEEGEGGLLRAPDWMSLSSKDWAFVRPVAGEA